MPEHLPFETPQGRLTPDELADIAEAVAGRPALWEDGLRQTAAVCRTARRPPPRSSSNLTATKAHRPAEDSPIWFCALHSGDSPP